MSLNPNQNPFESFERFHALDLIDDELRPPPDWEDTVFAACLIIENRIRIFEAERESSAPATLFDHCEGELKLLNALTWLFVEIPDDAWIVKL